MNSWGWMCWPCWDPWEFLGDDHPQGMKRISELEDSISHAVAPMIL